MRKRIPFLIALLVVQCYFFSAYALEKHQDVGYIDSGTHSNLYSISWRPDGRMACISGDLGTFLNYHPDEKKVEKVDVGDRFEFIMDVEWRPDGLYAIVVGDKGAAYMYNGQEFIKIPLESKRMLYAVSWAPSSSKSVIVGAGGVMYIFDGNTCRKIETNTSYTLYDASWTPNEKMITVVGEHGTMFNYDIESGKITNRSIPSKYALYSVSWCPNGSEALVTGENGVIWSFDGNAATVINENTMNVFLGTCWMKDGDEYVAYVCGDTGIILQYKEKRLRYIPTGLGSPLQDIEWNPSGNYLLSVGNKGKIVIYPVKNDEKKNDVCFWAIITICIGITAVAIGYYIYERK